MANRIQAGQEFGRGRVINPDIGRTPSRRILIRLMCAPDLGGCGTIYDAGSVELRSGNTRSCGCLRRDTAAAANKSHGLNAHPLYSVWVNMLARCENPAVKDYPNYGGRTPPITVCPEWHDVARFVADVEAEIGPRPAGQHPSGQPIWTFDRTDNDSNYGPGKIRWADRSQQRRNQRPRAQWTR